MVGFSVDTKLFRELGEFLVGRESTALVELIKNSYDADATKVRIYGENLDNPKEGVIIVKDNGIGMNESEFEAGFLRIAGRSKAGTNRRSKWFKRRFTGEKGIGRLAAHKLARVLQISSWRWNEDSRDGERGFPATDGVTASIDWDAVEKCTTLSEVEKGNAVSAKGRKSKVEIWSTTELKLSGLRKIWGTRELRNFHSEVATLTPPKSLVEPLKPGALRGTHLFSVPKIRDGSRDGGFEVDFEGELKLQESTLPAIGESASWIIEIDSNAELKRLRIKVSPCKSFFEKFSIAESFSIEKKIRSSDSAISFQARVFQRTDKAWPSSFGGVRVYYEGFRVLPYGDQKDDWLELDQDYRSRAHGELGRLQKLSEWKLPAGDADESLVQQGSHMFFGGVFLTREGAPDLSMLINREGFLPSPSFDFIADTVRLGIDLQVRLRYAATKLVKGARSEHVERQRQAVLNSDSEQPPSAFLVAKITDDAKEALKSTRKALLSGDVKQANKALAEVEQKLREASELSDESASELTMYRVLAALGLEHAAFVHEVNSLALSAQMIASSLERIGRQSVSPTIRKKFKALEIEVLELRERLRRNAIYLTDVTGIEGRRRRSRQILFERFELALTPFKNSIEKKNITISNRIPEKLSTPPMFPAEVNAIISNLLSNAIKFAGKSGRVLASASKDEDEFVFRLENTGAEISLSKSEKWFQPFRSTTAEVDETLGQGMGLGLTITRSLIDEYGGTIRFVKPSSGYQTAIELRLLSR